MAAPAPVLQLAIVGDGDRLLYELDLRATGIDGRQVGAGERTTYLNQFVMHAALDNVEEAQWGASGSFLKTVDRFNDLQVVAFSTAGNVRFLLLHNSKTSTSAVEEAAKSFFNEVYELYLRIMLNPFHDPTKTITNAKFTEKVKAAARRYINV